MVKLVFLVAYSGLCGIKELMLPSPSLLGKSNSDLEWSPQVHKLDYGVELGIIGKV